MSRTDVRPLPAGEVTAQLLRARSEAVDAILEAEEAEAEARKKRRRATGKLKHYEHLLLEFEHDGGLPIEGGRT